MAALANQTVVVSRVSDAVEQASNELDKFVKADCNYDDLSKRLRVYSEKSPNDSGLNDCDYPNLTDDKQSFPVLPEVNIIKRVPIPSELVEQFSRMQCNCMMGLFPDINRAWLTIDSDIFVWNYENGEDVAYFDSLKETIIACELVQPKSGACAGVPYLLVLTTPVEVYMLGVTFGDVKSQGSTSDPAYSEMNLLPTPLYRVASDNIDFLTVKGTADGRIFLGARDGSLCEVHYQAEDGWIYKKCRISNLTSGSIFNYLTPSFLRKDEEAIVQIEVDEDSHILFTRSEKGSLQVYDLGEDGRSVEKIAEMSSSRICSLASQIISTVDQSNFQKIIHIASISMEESVNIQLVAITEAGVRLYFTVKPFNTSSRPKILSLVHVRLPPGFSANSSMRPSKIHMAHYKRGNTLLMSSQSDELDLLWALSPDCLPFQSQLMETQMTLPIGGRTWALTEEPHQAIQWRQSPGESARDRCNPPLVVTQHMEELRRFILLSAQGTYIMHKLRPVDQLRALLIKNQGYDNPDVEAFFKLHRPEQACATCLILICSGLAVDAQVRDFATGAFFMYGGDPTYTLPAKPTTIGPNYSFMGQDVTVNQNLSFHPAQVSTPHPNKYGINTTVAPSGVALNAELTGQVVLSAKHDGIYIYLARILSPLWDSQFASELKVKHEAKNLIVSRVDRELGFFIEQLSNLLQFLRSSSQYIGYMNILNPHPFSLPGSHPYDDATRQKHIAEAINKEKLSLQNCTTLISRVLEILNLWKVSCEHQFELVCKGLSEAQQSSLKMNTLKTFLSPGADEVLSAIVNGIIQLYLGDNACTDIISSRLRELCPSLYSVDDAKCSKASEILKSLVTINNTAEKKSRVAEAMKLYKEVSPHLNLQQVCTLLADVHCYDGILDLSLTTAARLDAQNVALFHYRSGELAEDTAGYKIYCARMDCYNIVLDTLKFLLTASSATTSNTMSIPNKPGPPAQKTDNSLGSSEAEHFAETFYRKAINSSDELFHVALYDWMIRNNLTDRLLGISSPFLEAYLQRSAAAADSQGDTLEILWRFYEKNKNYSAASQILYKIASNSNLSLDLTQRIEYISRAVISAKSASFRFEKADTDFLHELEERLDVARVQLFILDNLRKLPKSDQQERALAKLGSELTDITTLYGSYAEPFDLAECKLAILQCAGHYDSTLIEMLWASIVDKEFKSTEGSSTENRMLILQNKMVSLAKTFSSNDKFFPLSFIVTTLELQSLINQFAVDWVIKVMKSAHVNMLQLLQTYEGLHKEKDPCWRNHQNPHRLLDVVAALVEDVLKDSATLSTAERKRFELLAQDMMSRYLIELQSSTHTSRQPGAIAKYRDLQSMLQRSLKF